MRRRLACACALVVVLIAAMVTIDRCFPSTFQGSDQGDHISDQPALSKYGADGKEGSAAPIIDLLGTKQQFGAAVPEAFEHEIIGLEAFEEVLVTEDGSTVGLLSRGSASQVYRRLSEELAHNGWIGIESGQEGIASFAKKDGTYTWLLISCSEIDGWVSVVVRAR